MRRDFANLTPRAARDLANIVRHSIRNFGVSHADRIERSILMKCVEIGQGMNHGHKRADVINIDHIRFIVVHPFVIAYSPATRLVIPILDGRRDFSKLF